MGKSPGKWIKTVLFGKKYSKSNFSKGAVPDKNTATKTPLQDASQNSPVISDPYPMTEIGVETLDLEREASGLQCDAIALSPVNRGVDSPNGQIPVSLSDADMKSQNEAAAKVQASFRGYLARRAFQALKGIIRLQALIRGHLVRRQAVATLRCMRAIVKIQALARGHKDAKQVGVGANMFFGSQKLATNIFVRKLLVKMPNDSPLSLQYDMAEPNSSWTWLERWSASHIWEAPVRAKRSTKPKPQRKTLGLQTAESETGKSKRTIRKAPIPLNGENGSLTSETDKPKRNPGKLTSTQMETAQEQAASELERVKRNLRKVSSSSSAPVPEKQEVEIEKQPPLPSVEVVKTSPPHDAPDLEIANSPEKPSHPEVGIDLPDILETPFKNELVNAPLDENPAVETETIENGAKIESVPNMDDDISVKEEQISKEAQKVKKRRSLPAKQEFTEKISQNSPSVPSYMAATESAKAKLRAQGSTSKFVEDGAAEYSGNARRHSLPASNGKLSSLSPRVQKPVLANGKGGSKTNMALTASRDDKAALPGWRR